MSGFIVGSKSIWTTVLKKILNQATDKNLRIILGQNNICRLWLVTYIKKQQNKNAHNCLKNKDDPKICINKCLLQFCDYSLFLPLSMLSCPSNYNYIHGDHWTKKQI